MEPTRSVERGWSSRAGMPSSALALAAPSRGGTSADVQPLTPSSRDFGFDRNRRAPLRDATAVIEKQHRAIAALTEKVARLETLLDQSLHIAKAIARDPDLPMKTSTSCSPKASPHARKPPHTLCATTRLSGSRLLPRGGSSRSTAATCCRSSVRTSKPKAVSPGHLRRPQCADVAIQSPT